MLKKLLIVSLSLVAVVPAFATLTVTSISTDLRGASKSNTDSHSYSSQLPGGSDYQSVNSAMTTASGYAEGYASAYQSGQSAYGYSYARSSSSVVGVGTASGSATTYTRLNFTLSVDSVITYAVAADGTSSGSGKNSASIEFEYDSTSGAGPLPTANLGDSLTGTIALSAGTYYVELYNMSKTSAKGTRSTSLASATSFGESSFEMHAQAVPEPASMAVLAIGAVALLRRRKKA